MDDVLTQDEVDSLFGDDAEPAGPVADAEPTGPRPYDLAHQERIVRGRMPTLEIVNERYARNLRIGLFNFMRKNPEISVGPVRVNWRFADTDEDLTVQPPDVAAEPSKTQAYLKKALELKGGRVAPDGDNCHKDFGGLREAPATTFLPRAGQSARAAAGRSVPPLLPQPWQWPPRPTRP